MSNENVNVDTFIKFLFIQSVFQTRCRLSRNDVRGLLGWRWMQFVAVHHYIALLKGLKLACPDVSGRLWVFVQWESGLSLCNG